MPGAEQVTSTGGTHTVTVGTADDTKTPCAATWVSKQDDQGTS